MSKATTLLALGLFLSAPGFAADRTWTGNGIAYNWDYGYETYLSDENNWDVLPVSGVDSWTFGSANTFGATTLFNTWWDPNNLDSPFSVSAITFNAGAPAFTEYGWPIVLTGSIVNKSTNLQTLGSDIDLGGSQRSITLNGGGGDLQLTGVLSGSGGGISVGGTGALILRPEEYNGWPRQNLYTGTTSIGGAVTLKLANEGALGSGVLELRDGAPIIENVYRNGAMSFGNNLAINTSFSFAGTQDLAFTGTTLINGAKTITTSGSASLTLATLDGTTTEASLTKDGSGVLVVTGSAGSNFQGGVTLDAGELRVGNDAALGNGALVLNSGTFSSVGSQKRTLSNEISLGNVSFGSDENLGELVFNGNVDLGQAIRSLTTNADVSFVGAVSGSGISKFGSGLLVLSHVNYTGATTVHEGTLELDFAAAGAPSDDILSGDIVLGANTTLSVRGSGTANNSQGGNIVTGEVGHRSIIVDNNNGSGTTTLNVPGVFERGANSSATLDFDLSQNLGTGGVAVTSTAAVGTINWVSVKDVNGVGFGRHTGTEVVRLTGQTALEANNAQEGGDFIFSGSSLALASGTHSIGTLTMESGAIDYQNSIFESSIDLNGGRLSLSALLSSGSRQTRLTNGSIAIDSELIVHQTGYGDFYLDASATGAGRLTKTGLGTMYITGSQGWTGGTVINQGTLSLLDNGSSSLTGNITNYGNFQIGSHRQGVDFGSITGIGTLTVSTSGTATLIGGNTYTGTTILDNGVLHLGAAEVEGVSGPLGASAADNPGSIVFNYGVLQYSELNQHDYSGRFSQERDQTFRVDTNGQNVTWASNLINENGAIYKTGSGSLTLTGNNKLDGISFVAGGELRLNSSGVALGDAVVEQGARLKLFGSNQIDDKSWVSIAEGGTFDMQVHNQTLFGLYSWGDILGSGTLTLLDEYNSPESNWSYIDGGEIEVTLAGNRTLVIGEGAPDLGGTTVVRFDRAHTYTGVTRIHGTLELGASGSISNSSNINLGSSQYHGTLDVTAKNDFTVGHSQTLSGYGAINIGEGKTVTVSGTLAPGNSPGVISIDGNLALTGSSTTTMELAGPGGVAGVDFDRVSLTGTFTYGGALNVTSYNGFDLQQVGSFQLFDFVAYAGNFDSVTVGDGFGEISLLYNGEFWSRSNSENTFAYKFYNSTGTFEIASVPEPNACLMFCGGLAVLRLMQRRRRVS